MTGHFIIDFMLQSVMLSCQCFKGRHTAENICRIYEDVINYNIQNKVSFIVTDNASNMIKAFTLFPPMHVVESEEEEQDETSDFEVVNVEEETVYFPPERSSCFVHTLQLVVRDAMDDAGSIKKLTGKGPKTCFFLSQVHTGY